MEIFSPVFWLRIRYSPGEDAASIFTRALARFRFAATSIQRWPLLSTLKISNGGIMAVRRNLSGYQITGALFLQREYFFCPKACTNQTYPKTPNTAFTLTDQVYSPR